MSHPFIYEINTWPWLAAMSAVEQRTVDLGSVAAHHWEEIAALGFDSIWLMGVWERSPAGIAIALSNEGLRQEFESALPDWAPDDVVGSPYCVRDYVVDGRLGGTPGLAAARRAMAEVGLRLILDFVPNHVALDHPWTVSNPGAFVAGTDDDIRADPHSFVRVGDRVLANGKDPYFAAWPDVVQLDAFAPELRAASVAALTSIAGQCDGVRCDMAMLMMNDVFARTWGKRVGPAPTEDYWPAVIPDIRAAHPDFLFIAEAYWGTESSLIDQGFDYCYDKALYDALVSGGAARVRTRLEAGNHDTAVRFVENHDEPRAAATFEPMHARAAAVAMLTQTGARLVHDGQCDGRRVRLPVFLGRYPDESFDPELREFYTSLLSGLRDETFRSGIWRLGSSNGWPDNHSHRNLLAWSWEGATRWVVIVNFSAQRSSGLIDAPWPDLAEGDWLLVDPSRGTSFERTGDDWARGLFVELDAWAWHLFRIDPITRH